MTIAMATITMSKVGEPDLSRLKKRLATGRAQARPGQATFRSAICGSLRGPRER